MFMGMSQVFFSLIDFNEQVKRLLKSLPMKSRDFKMINFILSVAHFKRANRIIATIL